MSVAQTILDQLGGNKFIVMTGAKHFLHGDKALTFGIGRGAKGGINKVRVTLDSSDLYSVEFFKVRGADFKVIGVAHNAYADQLQRVFTENTGFDTHL